MYIKVRYFFPQLLILNHPDTVIFMILSLRATKRNITSNPHIYTWQNAQITLLHLYRFQPDPDYTGILTGITNSIRRIQDPLITVYAMAYLLYVTQSLSMPECSSEYIIDIAEYSLGGFSSKKVCLFLRKICMRTK